MKRLIVDDDREAPYLSGYLLERDPRFEVAMAPGSMAGLEAPARGGRTR